MHHETLPEHGLRQITGSAFIGGAVVLIVANLLFPRAEDPWDTAAVLTMMADSQTLRQVSFLAVVTGLMAVTAGLVGIQRSLSSGSAAVWARIGLAAALVGAAMVTSRDYPRWLGFWILVTGFANALLVGVPLAFGAEAAALFLVFGAFGMLTAVWALATGVWVLRRLR